LQITEVHMKFNLFLFLFVNLFVINGIVAQDAAKAKTKSKSKSTESKTSKNSSRKNKKNGGKDDTYKSDKNRDKKEDTQSMLRNQAGVGKKEKKADWVSRPLYYAGRTYTGTIENIPGYRICVYTGNNRQEAMRTKAAFNGRFRTIRSYMSYNLPNYKIKVGNYEEKKAALKALKEIQIAFPAAFVSPDKVTIVRRQLYVKPQPVSEDGTTINTTSTDNTAPKPKPKKKKVAKPVEQKVEEVK
jgi:hypothetical protein